jgi:hypothetical protein
MGMRLDKRKEKPMRFFEKKKYETEISILRSINASQKEALEEKKAKIDTVDFNPDEDILLLRTVIPMPEKGNKKPEGRYSRNRHQVYWNNSA